MTRKIFLLSDDISHVASQHFNSQQKINIVNDWIKTVRESIRIYEYEKRQLINSHPTLKNEIIAIQEEIAKAKETEKYLTNIELGYWKSKL